MRLGWLLAGGLAACAPQLELTLSSLADVPNLKNVDLEFVIETEDLTATVRIPSEPLPIRELITLPKGFETEFLHITATAFVGEKQVGQGSVDLAPGETEAAIRFAVCGNDAVEDKELCDNPDLVDGDGCDSTCKPTGCASGVSTPGELCFFENDNLVGPEGPLQVLTQDLNGDELPDLIAPYRAFEGAPEVVRVFLNGETPFGSFQEISLPGVKQLTLGDIDADGDVDIIGMVKQPSLAPQVAVLLNNGGEFSLSQQSFLSAQDVGALALGSLNGDQFPDLVYLDPVANTLNVLLATPKGGFSTQQQSFAVGAGPVALALADLDNNGKLDALTANSSGSVSVLMNDGASFTEQRFSVVGVPSSLVLGEFDIVPGLDLAVAKQDGGGEIRLFSGDNNGNFLFVGDFEAPDSPSALIAADLDGDGDLDLATTSRSASVIAVLFNNGSGQFDPPRDASEGIFETRQGPVSLAVSDLNNDQVPDLIVAGLNLGVLLSNP